MTSGALVVAAAVAAGAAVWLLFPGVAHAAPSVWAAATGIRRARWWPALVLPVAALALLPWRLLAVVAVAVAAGTTGHRLVVARRQRMSAERTAARGLESCEQLAAELASGQPPGAALDRTAREWPPLRPVAESFRVGGDVPAAWRQLARRPGAGQLRYVGAAWQVAQASGHGLADALQRAAADLRSDEATRRVVVGELSSARATARLVAALPLLALLMGSGAGGNPWSFLLGHPVGLACLAGGVGLGAAGLWWIEMIARTVERR